MNGNVPLQRYDLTPASPRRADASWHAETSRREVPSLRYQAITRATVHSMPQWRRLSPEIQEAIDIVSLVFPFKSNNYVADHLIDWDRVPEDPIFQLTFPQKGMLHPGHYRRLKTLAERNASKQEIASLARSIQDELNPHPAGQADCNMPRLGGQALPGLQHKYNRTILFFPQQGQTCHAYCTFCFRWPQFVGRKELQIASSEVDRLIQYLRHAPDVSDVIFTGGDPMVMKTAVLRRYIEPLLELDSVTSIRIGSKSLAYWPYRYFQDEDADDLLRLFERVIAAGKHLSFMAHVSHPVELSTPAAEVAIGRILATGAVIRTQCPVQRHINDDPEIWASMWMRSIRLGMVPYYMFVERDTGPRGYFEMPIVRGWQIFQAAYQRVPGLARTVRGPVMSCFPGKCHVMGPLDTPAGRALSLEFLQARDQSLVRRPFLAQWDEKATWFDQLRPVSPADEPFFGSGSDEAPRARMPEAVRIGQGAPRRDGSARPGVLCKS